MKERLIFPFGSRGHGLIMRRVRRSIAREMSQGDVDLADLVTPGKIQKVINREEARIAGSRFA